MRPLPSALKAVAAVLMAAATVASCGSGGPASDSTEASVTETGPDAAETGPDAAASSAAGAGYEPSLDGSGTLTLAADNAAALPSPQDAAADATVEGPASPDDLLAAVIPDTPIDPADAQAANPTTIRIPTIGVDAPIIALNLLNDGSIEVPEATEETGWWRDGPEPGERGASVIIGHVDSRSGPAVFYRLRDLEPGNPIHVDREDGTTVTYLVERTEQHNKNDFPTEAVYGKTPEPTLRLVTCGGSFNSDRRSYVDNIIVFASII